MRRIAAGAGDPRGARVDTPYPKRVPIHSPRRGGSTRPGVVGDVVRHPENPHDAREESSYHASPVYGTNDQDVGRLTMGWGQQ
jgi:hypothetical protein